MWMPITPPVAQVGTALALLPRVNVMQHAGHEGTAVMILRLSVVSFETSLKFFPSSIYT